MGLLICWRYLLSTSELQFLEPGTGIFIPTQRTLYKGPEYCFTFLSSSRSNWSPLVVLVPGSHSVQQLDSCIQIAPQFTDLRLDSPPKWTCACQLVRLWAAVGRLTLEASLSYWATTLLTSLPLPSAICTIRELPAGLLAPSLLTTYLLCPHMHLGTDTISHLIQVTDTPFGL